MNLTDKQFAEIADNLLAGMIVVLEKKTGKIDFHPEEMDYFFDDEENPWKELIDKVEENPEEYILVEPMPSYESFKVMERFANRLEVGDVKTEAIRALNMRKPFRNFKDVVESSEYRQDWFDYQLQENIDWVKRQVELELD